MRVRDGVWKKKKKKKSWRRKHKKARLNKFGLSTIHVYSWPDSSRFAAVYSACSSDTVYTSTYIHTGFVNYILYLAQQWNVWTKPRIWIFGMCINRVVVDDGFHRNVGGSRAEWLTDWLLSCSDDGQSITIGCLMHAQTDRRPRVKWGEGEMAEFGGIFVTYALSFSLSLYMCGCCCFNQGCYIRVCCQLGRSKLPLFSI